MTASGADLQEHLDWLDVTLNRVVAASALSAAIIACHPDDREGLLEAALEHLRAGQPVPPFTSVMAEAINGADWASPAELKAYCLACYTRMPCHDQQAFLAHVSDRRAVA